MNKLLQKYVNSFTLIQKKKKKLSSKTFLKNLKFLFKKKKNNLQSIMDVINFRVIATPLQKNHLHLKCKARLLICFNHSFLYLKFFFGVVSFSFNFKFSSH